MRKLSDIRAAEKEMFDRVWYDRKIGMLHCIQYHGEEMPPEEIMDAMEEAMRKAEAKYGVDSLTTESEFNAGFINGKLAALRWVMGDMDWDDEGLLDT